MTGEADAMGFRRVRWWWWWGVAPRAPHRQLTPVPDAVGRALAAGGGAVRLRGATASGRAVSVYPSPRVPLQGGKGARAPLSRDRAGADSPGRLAGAQSSAPRRTSSEYESSVVVSTTQRFCQSPSRLGLFFLSQPASTCFSPSIAASRGVGGGGREGQERGSCATAGAGEPFAAGRPGGLSAAAPACFGRAGRQTT